MPRTVRIRFYEELNDFLPEGRKKVTFSHSYFGNPPVKDIIESLGVPHTEVDLILAGGKPVKFSHRPVNGEFISVYPVFETFDLSGTTLLRPDPLRKTRFILDVHLGKLARYLRMMGFDTLYDNRWEDPEIIDIALAGNRIILTRDLGILKNGKVTHGYFIRSDQPGEQTREVIRRFELRKKIKPVSRCIECNSSIAPVEKERVIDLLPDKTKKYFNEFYQCKGCGKVYWKGSHYYKMKRIIKNLLDE